MKCVIISPFHDSHNIDALLDYKWTSRQSLIPYLADLSSLAALSEKKKEVGLNFFFDTYPLRPVLIFIVALFFVPRKNHYQNLNPGKSLLDRIRTSEKSLLGFASWCKNLLWEVLRNFSYYRREIITNLVALIFVKIFVSFHLRIRM